MAVSGIRSPNDVYILYGAVGVCRLDKSRLGATAVQLGNGAKIVMMCYLS